MQAADLRRTGSAPLPAQRARQRDGYEQKRERVFWNLERAKIRRRADERKFAPASTTRLRGLAFVEGRLHFEAQPCDMDYIECSD